MDRWDFSLDFNPDLLTKSMEAIIPVDKPEDSNLGETTAAERGKAVKIAKGGAFQLQTTLFQRFRYTPVFIGQLLPFSFAPSHCSYRKKCPNMKIPINPHFSPATFNGIIRWKLKDTIVVSSFSPNSETV